MYALNRLSRNRKYLISNYPGQWYFSRVTGNFATFYKFTQVNTRVAIKLPLTKVQDVVWEQISLDLSNLESQRGE